MFFVALTAVTAMVIGNNVDDGLVGLVMSYVISVTGALNWVVRSASEVEQNIVSAERSEWTTVPRLELIFRKARRD
jgi:hypothetical protein